MDRRVTRRVGFALVELLLALTIGSMLIGGLLSLFRGHSRMVRRQSHAADLQQSLRIASHELARRCRPAGRGGLSSSGVVAAVAVLDNVAAGLRIGGPASSRVVAGTDVLVLRGVFAAPVYEVASGEAGGAGAGRVVVRASTSGGASQDLGELTELSLEEVGGALLLAGSPGAGSCAVVELTGSQVVATAPSGAPEELALDFRSSGSTLADAYGTLCDPRAPIESISRVGFLEEYRYYIRPDPAGSDRASLARARYRPGSDVVRPGSPRDGEDLVDNALDLQVALAGDLNGDGRFAEGNDDTERGEDEWLLNDDTDDPDAPIWSGVELDLIRFSLLLRSHRPEPGYLSPAVWRLENRLYQEPSVPETDLADRRYQRGLVSATVRRRR